MFIAQGGYYSFSFAAEGNTFITKPIILINNIRRLVTLAEHTSEAPTMANKQTQAQKKGGAGLENC